MPAVILCSSTTGLAAIRSLHRAGIPTIAVADGPENPVLLSRYPQRKFTLNAAAEEDRSSALLRLLNGLPGPKAVLIPTSDAFVSFMVKNREVLAQRFYFSLPPNEIVETLLDKPRETEKMMALGVAIPPTVFHLPDTPGRLGNLLRLPLIIKPRSAAHLPLLGRKNVIIRTCQELELFYQEYGSVLGSMIAQEVVPGGDENVWGCNCTFNQSHDLIAAFTRQKLGMAPAHYGVTTYAVSRTNREVVRLCALIGKQLQYVGTAGFEFKLDARDGIYYYIEINPRMGMLNYFNACCGVPTVLLGYQVSLGWPAVPVLDQRDGVMYLDLYDDLYFRRQDGERLVSILRRYARHAGRPHVWAYFTWGDPWPGLVTGWRELRQAARHFAARLGAAAGRSS